jgi:Pyridoxamine 5'-phosphate oxidase
MAKVYEGIDDRLREFILAQPVFFVATAPSGPGGHVNVSPKGGSGCFAVLDERRVAYLDFTGSGAETIAHLRDNGRIVVMFCAFAGPPKIARLHGRGRCVTPDDPRFVELVQAFPGTHGPGLRSIIEIEVARVSDSCGFQVPLMTYTGDRSMLADWAERKGPDGMAEYRATRNATSIDGLPALPVG